MTIASIRTENRRKIVQLLVKERELTISEISRSLHISIPTVTKNVEQLVDEGLAEKAGVSDAVVGRKPVMIKFCPNAYYAGGVELLTQSVRLALTNLDADIVCERTLPVADYQDLPAIMQAVADQFTQMLAAQGIARRRVSGIGCAVPGVVNAATRLLKIAPNLGLKHCAFDQYEDLFGVPVWLENEANAAALAELKVGLAKELQNLVYVSVLHKGIGTGIVVDGHLYRGKHQRAGEYGHTTVASHGRRCACGRRDCWELYASGKALLTGYAERAGRTPPDSLAHFFDLLNAKDSAAVAAFDEYLEYMALGIEDIILVQDPHYVIVGGVLTPFAEIVMPPLQEKIFQENNFYDGTEMTVMASTLQGNSTILGAALQACQDVLC